ncbi:MAG: CNNM domain-containing protein [Planctomycetota bacterium]|jgi:CBS domain containing-hemolysin-like protein
MVNSAVLILIAVFAVFLSGLFAGSETGIYQLSRLRLRLGIEKKRLSFVILGKIMDDSPVLLISILIGTNLAYYITTSAVTYIFLERLQHAHTAELLATLVTAPSLFIFSELIPKSIFYYRSDTLMPYAAPILFVFKKFFTWCGILPLLTFISRLFAQLTGSLSPPKTAISAVQRHHIKAMMAETREEGILSPVQTGLINRLVNISNTAIGAVMTPVNKVEMVDVNSDNSVLLDTLKRCAFTRLPVSEKQRANIVGFINIYEALSSAEQFSELRNFIKPVRKLGGNTAVIEAINIMQRENQKIVLVTRVGRGGRERPIGIVTMKDLVEELLGELAEW